MKSWFIAFLQTHRSGALRFLPSPFGQQVASASLFHFLCLFIPLPPPVANICHKNGWCYLKSLTVTGCLSKRTTRKGGNSFVAQGFYRWLILSANTLVRGALFSCRSGPGILLSHRAIFQRKITGCTDKQSKIQLYLVLGGEMVCQWFGLVESTWLLQNQTGGQYAWVKCPEEYCKPHTPFPVLSSSLNVYWMLLELILKHKKTSIWICLGCQGCNVIECS